MFVQGKYGTEFCIFVYAAVNRRMPGINVKSHSGAEVFN